MMEQRSFTFMWVFCVLSACSAQEFETAVELHDSKPENCYPLTSHQVGFYVRPNVVHQDFGLLRVVQFVNHLITPKTRKAASGPSTTASGPPRQAPCHFN